MTPAARLSPAWTASKLINVLTLETNRTNVPAVTKSSHRNHTSIVISRHTKNALQNTPLSVQRAAKRFTTARLTTLIYAPRINNPPPPLAGNDQPLKHQMLRLQRKPRRLLRLARVQLHQPFLKRQPLLLLLLVPAGKPIQSLRLPILYPVTKKTLFNSTVNTGFRSELDLAVTTDCKTGTIFAWPPSIPVLSANSSTASFPIRPLSSK